jgi:hypothetical protein
MAQEQLIKMEAFNTNLHGCRILCQGPFSKRYPPMMDSIQKLRDPYKKKILLAKSALAMSKYMPMAYDAVFQMKDSADWTLALTYMTYAPKPILIVTEDITIPDGLWQKLTRQMTFVNFTSTPVLHIRPYDAIFFAPVEELSSSQIDYGHKILQSVYRSNYSTKEHKEIVQELRVAGAGLVWTKVEEESQGGNVFWYDPISLSASEKLTNTQLVDLFGFLASQFSE